MVRSKGKHGRRLLRTCDDPDALVIDLDSIGEVKGTLLHFHELRTGDMFSTELWYDDALDRAVVANLYLGGGHYFTMSRPDERGFTDPESGALVTLLSRMPSGTVEEP